MSDLGKIINRFVALLSKRETSAVFLGFILTIGFLLRTYGNSSGLPFYFLKWDMEYYIISNAINMVMTGDLNPHTFTYPTLLYYCYAIIFKLEIILDRLGLIYVDRSTLILTARFLSAIFGILTIFLIYQIGKTLFNKLTGIIAAIFLMIIPSAVIESHYASVDTPLTFFVTLSFFFASQILKKGELRYYILAGIAAGLAASIKYPGILILFTVFIAHIIFVQKIWVNEYYNSNKFFLINKNFIFSFIASCLAFMMTTPFAILDYHTFLASIGNDYRLTHKFASQTNWFIYNYYDAFKNYIELIREALTINLEIILLAGVIYCILSVLLYIIRRRRHDSKLENLQASILLLSWIIVYFLFISSLANHPARYLVPLFPFLAIAGANFLNELVEFLGRIMKGFNTTREAIIISKSIFLLVICGYLIIAPIQISVALDRVMTNQEISLILPYGYYESTYSNIDKHLNMKPDARIEAFNWVRNNIPKYTIMMKENPILDPEIELLENITVLSGDLYPRYDLNKLIERKIGYIIINRDVNLMISDTNNFDNRTRFYRSLIENCKLVKEFDGEDYLIGPIRIYEISEVPPTSQEIGNLAMIDPISKRRFGSWGVIN